MEVQYRESFLRDLKKLKKHRLYDKIYTLAFETLPQAEALTAVPGVTSMTGYPYRYRIRVGSYRIGIEMKGGVIEIIRALDRREFYRYFP